MQSQNALPVPCFYNVNLGAHELVIDQQGMTLASNDEPELVVALDDDEMYRLCVTLQLLFAERMHRTLRVDEPLPEILTDAEALAWHEAQQQ